MQELLNARPPAKKPFFLIDFEDRPVGSQGLIVKSDETWNFVRTTQNSPTDGVVDHPTYGKCYRLDGNVAFREPSKKLDLLLRPNWRLDMEFVTERDYVQLFETGADSSSKNGWNMWTTTQTNRWIWGYLRNGGGAAISTGSGPTPLNTLNRISVVKSGSALKLKDENTGISNDVNISTLLATDSYFTIMCGYTGFGGAGLGYLKRWEVRLTGY